MKIYCIQIFVSELQKHFYYNLSKGIYTRKKILKFVFFSSKKRVNSNNVYIFISMLIKKIEIYDNSGRF